MKCIFLSANSMKSAQVVDPEGMAKMIVHEKSFRMTMKRNKSLEQLLDEGTAYDMAEKWIEVARSQVFCLPIVSENWQLPVGAFSSNDGPS